MRLKVPPAIAQFQHVLDRNTAAQALKLLSKYRPESKQEKKERLTKEATAISEGKKKEDVSKKPYAVKYGLNHGMPFSRAALYRVLRILSILIHISCRSHREQEGLPRSHPQ